MGHSVFNALGALKTAAASKGAALVTYFRPETGAVGRSVYSRLMEDISIFDFLSETHAAEIVARSYSTLTRAALLTAIQNALDAADDGQQVYFPSGLYELEFTTNGANLLTISNTGTRLVFGRRAEIKAHTTAALTTVAQETDQFIFKADGVDEIEITGGKFNGNKGAGNDPAAGLIQLLSCNNFSLQGMTFVDCSQIFGGLVFSDSYNGTTNTPVSGFHVSGCRFERCNNGIINKNHVSTVRIKNNHFKDMALDDPDTPTTRYATSAPGGICYQHQCFEDYDETDGDIRDIIVTENTVEGATRGIVIDNTDATYGDNPANVIAILVTNNQIWSFDGITVWQTSLAKISDNGWKRLLLTSGEMTAYAGDTVPASSASVAGKGINAIGLECTIANNVIDGGFAAGATLDGNSYGIVLGGTAANEDFTGSMTGNRVRSCYIGTFTYTLEFADVVANTFVLNKYGFYGNPATMHHCALKDNYFLCMTNADSGGVDHVTLQGHHWHISGNVFDGNRDDPTNGALLIMGASAQCDLVANTFVHFDLQAIDDKALKSFYNGNTFNRGQGAATARAMDLYRQNNKKTAFINEFGYNLDCFIKWFNAAGTGETYEANMVWLNEGTTGFYEIDSGSSGAAAEFDVICGFQDWDASNQPPAGGWHKGVRIYCAIADDGTTNRLGYVIDVGSDNWASAPGNCYVWS